MANSTALICTAILVHTAVTVFALLFINHTLERIADELHRMNKDGE